MTDDPSKPSEQVYGLDISQIDPHSSQYQQTFDLICLCRVFDRFHGWLLPVDHHALLRIIERECTAAGVAFASLDLPRQADNNWCDRLERQRRYTRPQIGETDETVARRIAEQKLIGTDYVLRSGVVIHDGDVWRFAIRLAGEPDVPYNGQEMAVTVRVGPEDFVD